MCVGFNLCCTTILNQLEQIFSNSFPLSLFHTLFLLLSLNCTDEMANADKPNIPYHTLCVYGSSLYTVYTLTTASRQNKIHFVNITGVCQRLIATIVNYLDLI